MKNRHTFSLKAHRLLPLLATLCLCASAAPSTGSHTCTRGASAGLFL